MNETLIIQQLISIAKPGTVVPKPRATKDFIVKGIGSRRGDRALIYFIPNLNNPAQPYQKGFTFEEFEKAFSQLIKTGIFTRTWFNEYLAKCANEGGCNFTSIGGMLELLGYARYSGDGVYRFVKQ